MPTRPAPRHQPRSDHLPRVRREGFLDADDRDGARRHDHLPSLQRTGSVVSRLPSYPDWMFDARYIRDGRYLALIDASRLRHGFESGFVVDHETGDSTPYELARITREDGYIDAWIFTDPENTNEIEVVNA